MNTDQSTDYIRTETLLHALPNFASYFSKVNNITLHYVKGGKGEPLFLLPGWPETWWAFHKILPALAEHFTVIVVEYRGMGASDKPASVYDKKTMAADIHELVKVLGYQKISIAGHDVGAMVAFSFAANYPDSTAKLILIDMPHPDRSLYSFSLLPAPGTFGDGTKANPAAPFLWWFAFHQVQGLAEDLLEGRVHLEHRWFFRYLLGDEQAITDFDYRVYASAYQTREAISASNSWFRSFEQDIMDMESYDALRMPVLGLGAGAFGWLSAVLPPRAKELTMVQIQNCGHFPMEEKPQETLAQIISFLAKK